MEPGTRSTLLFQMIDEYLEQGMPIGDDAWSRRWLRIPSPEFPEFPPTIVSLGGFGRCQRNTRMWVGDPVTKQNACKPSNSPSKSIQKESLTARDPRGGQKWSYRNPPLSTAPNTSPNRFSYFLEDNTPTPPFTPSIPLALADFDCSRSLPPKVPGLPGHRAAPREVPDLPSTPAKASRGIHPGGSRPS